MDGPQHYISVNPWLMAIRLNIFDVSDIFTDVKTTVWTLMGTMDVINLFCLNASKAELLFIHNSMSHLL